MSKNYLTEAFKELDLLESQSFDVDKKGTSELEDFLEDDSLDDFEVVIDPEAKTEEDLQKSYMGKAILMCDVCRSMIYKDPKEIIIDEESQLANVGELCPYCFTGDGYKVVGKVAPYEEITIEAETPVKVKVDGKEVEVEGKVDECLGSKQLMIEKKVKNEAAMDAFNLIKNNIKEFKSDKEAWKDFSYDPSTKDYKQPSKEDLKTIAQLVSKMDVKGNPDNFTVTVADSIVEPFIDVNMDIHPDYNSDLYNLYDRKEIGKNKVSDKYELRTYQFTLKDSQYLKEADDLNPPLESYKRSLVRYINDKIKSQVSRDDYVYATDHEEDYEWGTDLKDSYEKILKVFEDLGLIIVDQPSGDWDIYAKEDKSGGRIEIQHMSKVAKKLMDRGFKVSKAPKRSSNYKNIAVLDTSNPDEIIYIEKVPLNSPIFEEDRYEIRTLPDSRPLLVSWNSDNLWIESYPPMSAQDTDAKIREILKDQMKSFKDPYNHTYDIRVNGLTFTITPNELKEAGSIDRLTPFRDLISYSNPEDGMAYDLITTDTRLTPYENFFGGDDLEEEIQQNQKFPVEHGKAPVMDVDLSEGYSKKGFSWEERNGEIKIFLDGKYHQTFPSKEAAMDAGWDLDTMNEEIQQDQKFPVNHKKSPVMEGQEILKGRYKKFPLKKSTLKENKDKNLKESMDDISITTEDQVIKIKSTPREDKETIQPVTETEIEDAKEEEPEYEEENIDLDEVEEEGIDEVSESYLKHVYENVQNFKTSKATLKGDSMIIEGVITFKSGKKAKTHFIFESQEVTKRGKLKFLGENKQISKNKKAFTLIGSVKNKKLLIESFNYNYTGMDSKTGKTKRLYGTIRRSK